MSRAWNTVRSTFRPPPPSDFEVSSSGLWVPRQNERTLQAVDLFAGCGGFSLGMHAAGIDVVGAVALDDDEEPLEAEAPQPPKTEAPQQGSLF